MGVHCEETDACGVNAGDDEVRADVALVAEEVLFEQCHDSNDSRGAACAETVELEVRGCEGRSELCVCSCAGASTPDLGGDVVQLLAVFVGDDRTGGGAGVGGDDDAILVYAAYDGCACRRGFGEGDAAGMQGGVAVVVAEIEAGHCEGCVKARALGLMGGKSG